MTQNKNIGRNVIVTVLAVLSIIFFLAFVFGEHTLAFVEQNAWRWFGKQVKYVFLSGGILIRIRWLSLAILPFLTWIPNKSPINIVKCIPLALFTATTPIQNGLGLYYSHLIRYYLPNYVSNKNTDVVLHFILMVLIFLLCLVEVILKRIEHRVMHVTLKIGAIFVMIVLSVLCFFNYRVLFVALPSLVRSGRWGGFLYYTGIGISEMLFIIANVVMCFARKEFPVHSITEASMSAPLFCANCGSPLHSDAAFCSKCGTPVES